MTQDREVFGWDVGRQDVVHDQVLYARVTRLEATVKMLKEWIDQRELELHDDAMAERERSE